LSNPQRLVVDLYNVKNTLAAKSLPINSFGVENARLGAYPDKVRIVFDSQKKVFPRYTLEKTDNGLLVRFDEQQATAMAPGRATPITRSSSSEPAAVKVVKRGASSVEFIDFKVIGDVSRVSISLDGECEVAGPTKTSEGLVLTFSKCLCKCREKNYSVSSYGKGS